MAKFKTTKVIRNVLKQHGVPANCIWTNKYTENKRTVKFYASTVHLDNAKVINEVKKELANIGEQLVDIRFGNPQENLERMWTSPASIIFEVNV